MTERSKPCCFYSKWWRPLSLPVAHRIWGILGGMMVVLLLTGCAGEEGIRTYRVAKEDRTPRRVLEQPTGQRQRMVAAIVPHGEAAWFFKFQAAPEVVQTLAGDFDFILASVHFEPDGVPHWELPDEWSQVLEQGITYARISHQGSGAMITVTRLPTRGGDDEAAWQRYVADNINRWRGQLSLPPASWEEIAGAVQELSRLTEGKRKAYRVELEGQSSGGGMAAPFVGAMAPAGRPTSIPGAEGGEPGAPPAVSATTGSSKDSNSPLQFEIPEGWRSQDVSHSAMRLAAFAIDGEHGAGEVTVIRAGGEARDNLGIWFGQIGVQPDAAKIDAVMEAAETVQVQDRVATVFWVDGLQWGSDQAVLVAMIPDATGESLFVKLKGDAKLVDAHRAAFQRFVTSLKW
ncbi:MAG: hypothetical protein KatS3mg111_2820 [Pirellulaceae bacterium]|nr:MAG: hypothetical protein KatS3mg111_2820 [Pirellulaceae bacterium]